MFIVYSLHAVVYFAALILSNLYSLTTHHNNIPHSVALCHSSSDLVWATVETKMTLRSRDTVLDLFYSPNTITRSAHLHQTTTTKDGAHYTTHKPSMES